MTPPSCGKTLTATNVSKPFFRQSPKPALQDQLPDNQCSRSHGNHLLPLNQAKCNTPNPHPCNCSHLYVSQFQLQAQMNTFINFSVHSSEMGVGCTDVWESSAPQQQDAAGRNIHMRITVRHLFLQACHGKVSPV